MVDVYPNERRMYNNITKMNVEDEDYEQDMRNAVEDLKREEAQRETVYQAIKTTPLKLKSQGHVHEDE